MCLQDFFDSRALAGAWRSDICFSVTFSPQTGYRRTGDSAAFPAGLHPVAFVYNHALLLHSCCRIHIISTAPECTVAIFKSQISKLPVCHQATISLQIAHESGNTHLRRNFNQHMYMIWTTFRLDDIYPFHSHNLRKISPMARFFSP